MHTILAIDTATAACSAALSINQTVKASFQHQANSHTQLLLPMVDELLVSAGIGVEEIDAIAFSYGPGSFTGIRIGFGVVQGLAFANDIPVVPVSTLELMAATARRKLSLARNQIVVPALDARMGEIYIGQYEIVDEGVTALSGDQVIPPEEALRHIPSNAVGVGDGWSLLAPMSSDKHDADSALLPEAEDLIPIARQRIAGQQLASIDDVQPCYLRDKVSWKKRQRLRDPIENKTIV